MSSTTDICNMALSYLGAAHINLITEDSDEAVACNTWFDVARDVVLSQGQWSFARERVVLAQSNDTPPFDWAYKYLLPVDLLEVSLVNGSKIIPFVIEGSYLLTNEESVSLNYIRKVHDTGDFTPLFTDSLAAYLGSLISVPITRRFDLQKELMQLYTFKLANAMSQDMDTTESKEQRDDQNPDNFSWVSARS